MKKKQIVPALVLFTLFTLFLAWQGEAQEISRIKPQTEAGFDLTAEAATRLLKKYNFTEEKRTDFYVDIYDGRSLLIDSHPAGYKFRMKVTDGEGVVQVNTKPSIQPASCPTTPSFVVNDKKLGELTLDKAQRLTFSELAFSQQEDLSKQPEKAAATIKQFHQFVQKLSIPLISEIQNIPGNATRWFYVSSFMAQKKKHSLKLKNLEGNIKVSITQGSDYLGSEIFQDRSEIEFQHDGSVEQSAFIKIICTFMAKENFSADDFVLENQDISPEVLRRLQKTNTTLGL